MKEEILIKLLLVKSTEEESPDFLTPEMLSKANIAAIGTKNDKEFLTKRAEYLFRFLPGSIKLWAKFALLPNDWAKPTLLVSFIFGVMSNYLGPSRLIHVIYNPLTILLLWSLLVYLLLFVKTFFKLGKLSCLKNETIVETLNNISKKSIPQKPKSGYFILDWIIGKLYKQFFLLKLRLSDDKHNTTFIKEIFPSFWKSYKEHFGKSLILRFKSLLNISAVGLVIGALVGVYFRGMFFNYNITWLSTFLTDVHTISLLLNILLGPANIILEGTLISANEISNLLLVNGTAAAPWIHRLAVSAIIIVFIPRTLLAFLFNSMAKRRKLNINLGNDYFNKLLSISRKTLVDFIQNGIKKIVRKRINIVATSIPEFVINDYFEKIISPIFISFRENGGKISEFENQLFSSQEKFEPILLDYLQEVQGDFRQTISNEINIFLDKELDVDINTKGKYITNTDEIEQKLPGRIASDIGDTISGTLVTAVAVAVGSISGGLGKSLGIAIISGLLGVSGPIGLLIGSLATIIALGGIYKIRRDKISGMIKEINLPAFVIQMALTDAKINKAREETFVQTQNEIRKILDPKIDEVADGILKDIAY